MVKKSSGRKIGRIGNNNSRISKPRHHDAKKKALHKAASPATHKAASHAHAAKAAPKTVHKLYSKKFCPNCGNLVVGEGILCSKCSGVDFDFKDLKIMLCNNCKSYNHKNKWQRFSDLNIVLERIVDEGVKHKVQYKDLPKKDVEELLSYKAGVNKEFTITVMVGKEKFDLPATVSVTLCPKCCKQGTKYFEGVLQVRNCTPEIVKFIKNDLSRQKSKGVHINKEIDLDGTGSNIDYYYTDKGHLRVIADKLRKHFGATVKQNAQLFSLDWSTSKNLYRLNVLVEFPSYHKDDVLKIGGQLYKIISMDEKIHATNLETNTKTLLPHKDSYDVLKPVEVMLIKRYPEFEVLDPNTYYQARLMNPSQDLQVNQKIKVVMDGGEAWLVKG